MSDYQISATVTAQVQNFQQGMNAVVTSSNNAQRAVNNTGTAVRNNTQNYMNFGRVIQDLPYGINGIANNLTQLIPSAGALGLAFTALVTAVTFAQIGFGAWTRGLNENKKALDNSKKASEEYLASLDQVTQAQLKGAQNAQKEVVELKTLYGITQDTTISIKQRKDAVDELQKQYPVYFKNIKDEAFLAGNAKTAYDSLTEAIIATGKARAAQDLIVKNASRGFENEQKLADLEKERLKQVNAVTKARQMQTAVDEQGSASLNAGGGSITAAKDLYDATKALEDTQRQIANIKTDNNILDKRNLELTKSITSEVKKGADLAGKIGGIRPEKAKPTDVITANMARIAAIIKSNDDETIKNQLSSNDREVAAIKAKYENEEIIIKKAADDARKQKGISSEQLIKIQETESTALLRIKNQEGEANLALSRRIAREEEEIELGILSKIRTQITEIARESKKNNLSGFLSDFGKGNNISSQVEEFSRSIEILKNKYLDGLLNFKSFQDQYSVLAQGGKILQATEDFNRKFSDITKSGLSESISGISEAIGTALANGGDVFQAVGQSLLSSLGGVLTQLGEMAIGVGIGLTAIKAALESLNPVLAISAGVALLALGSFFKGKASGIGGNIKGGGGGSITAFANGGIISGPTNALVGEYAGAKNNPEVIAPLNKLKSLIGNQEPFFQVFPIFDNKGLSIAVQRGDNQRKRT